MRWAHGAPTIAASRSMPTGKMFDGAKLDGPVSLRKALLNHSDAFIGTFTENLLAYGLGRVLEYCDMPAVRAIEREAARNGNRFSSFVMGIVKSPPFQMRRAEDAEPKRGGVCHADVSESALKRRGGRTSAITSRRSIFPGARFCAAWAWRWRCRCWIPWCRRRRRSSKTAAAPKTRLACIEMVHGAAGSTGEGTNKHYWSPEKEGARFRVEPDAGAARAFSRLHHDRQRYRPAPGHGLVGGRRRRGPFPVQRGLPDGGASEDDGRLGLLRRHLDRSNLRAAASARIRRCLPSSSASRWWTLRAPAITAMPAFTPTPSVGLRPRSRCP